MYGPFVRLHQTQSCMRDKYIAVFAKVTFFSGYSDFFHKTPLSATSGTRQGTLSRKLGIVEYINVILMVRAHYMIQKLQLHNIEALEVGSPVSRIHESIWKSIPKITI